MQRLIGAFILISGASLFGQSVVSCSSDDMRRHYCDADTRGGVRLVKQNSDAACREGETWGYDRRGIWVDRGCRADFQVDRAGREHFDRDRGSGGAVSTLSCASDDMRRHYCDADTRNGVRMAHQRSDAECRQGETWGFDERGIWVDRGCRADFEIGGGRRDRDRDDKR